MSKRAESEFDGTDVLEKLAVINKVDDFFEAIDNDDPTRAATLMKQAGVDAETIEAVLQQMERED